MTAEGELSAGSVRPEAVAAIDASRLLTLVGLSLGFVGPRAYIAISGVLLALLVASRASSALAIVFALSAGRLVSWIVLPLMGRASDRSRTRLGRRTPFMAAGLVTMGVCTWSFTLVRGYWPLVLLIVVVKQSAAVFGLTTVPAVPESFGRSRWLRALGLSVVAGTVVALIVKGTVIATWKSGDPSTWSPAFRLAGIIMVASGVLMALLVRAAPAAASGAEADRSTRSRSVSLEIRRVLAVPNATVLLGGALVFWAGSGATGYLAIVYFQNVLHAGASAQTVAGLLTAAPAIVVGLPVGFALSRLFTRKQIVVGAPIGGAVLFGVQFFATHLWQAVVLGVIGAPLGAAFLIVTAVYFVPLLPRAGGLGERIGLFVAPFSVAAVGLSFAAAAAVDATHDYRVVWIFPAGAGLIQAVVMCFFRVPVGQERVQWGAFVRRFRGALGEQFSGRGAQLLGGQVTADDADSAAAFDVLDAIFGDPYAEPGEQPSPGEAAPDEPATDVAPGPVTPPGGGGLSP